MVKAPGRWPTAYHSPGRNGTVRLSGGKSGCTMIPDPRPQPPQRMSASIPAGTPWSWRLGLLAAIVGLTTLAYLGQDFLGTRGQALIGVVCFLSVGLACSTNIRAINWRTVGTGIGLQVFLALMILKVPPVRDAFE